MSKKTIVEKETENKSKPAKKSRKSLYWLILAIVMAGAGYTGWKNQDFIKEKLSAYYQTSLQTASEPSEIIISPTPEWLGLVEEKADKATVYGLQEKLINLQTIVNELALHQNNTADMVSLNERIDNMQDLLIASVNGKADAQAVLGLIVRLDKMENELNRLSHLNNEGAIMLAATMLVKEKALEGQAFGFEAAMLIELAGDNVKIAEPLKVIENAAQTGIANNTELSREFYEIYNNLKKKEYKNQAEQTWKDRLLSKLSELIKINKAEEKQEEEKQNKLLDAIRDLYEHQQFSQISALLKDSKWAENPALQKWMQKVQARQDFESAISQISSYCLVLMKLNTLLPKE